MRKTLVAAAMLAAGVTIGEAAHAQAWLSDRGLTQGRGIRVGDFELHPGVGVEFGYDTNVFSAPDGSPQVQALRLRGTAHIQISTLTQQRLTNGGTLPNPSPPTLNFHAGLSVVGNGFFDLPGCGPTGPACFNNSNPSNVGVGANIGVELFPQRTWQFAIDDSFTRSTAGSIDLGLSPNVYQRDDNVANLALIFAPSRGEV